MKATSVLSAVIVALSLSVHNAVNAAALPDGKYQFISRITDPFGNQLALTSGTSGTGVTLSPLVFGQSNQTWAVKPSGSGNEITVDGTGGSVEAGTQGTLPQPLLTLSVGSGPFVWITTNVGQSGATITISDSSNNFNWAAPTATSSASVAVQSASPTPSTALSQLWVPIISSTSSGLT